MNAEKVKHHVEALKKKHADLDKLIDESYSHYDLDEFINKLKKEKLALKSEIEEFEKKLLR